MSCLAELVQAVEAISDQEYHHAEQILLQLLCWTNDHSHTRGPTRFCVHKNLALLYACSHDAVKAAQHAKHALQIYTALFANRRKPSSGILARTAKILEQLSAHDCVTESDHVLRYTNDELRSLAVQRPEYVLMASQKEGGRSCTCNDLSELLRDLCWETLIPSCSKDDCVFIFAQKQPEVSSIFQTLRDTYDVRVSSWKEYFAAFFRLSSMVSKSDPISATHEHTPQPNLGAFEILQVDEQTNESDLKI